MTNPLHETEVDEATRTPNWIPILGIAIFLTLIVWGVYTARRAPDATVEVPAQAEAPPSEPTDGRSAEPPVEPSVPQRPVPGPPAE